MARTPDQIGIARNSVNEIADPAGRLKALRELETELALSPGQGQEELLGLLRADVSRAETANAGSKPPGRTQEQSVVDKANADKAAEEDRQRKANAAQGKGYKTDAEVTAQAHTDTTAANQAALAPVTLEEAQTNLAKQKLELARLVANDPKQVEWAKLQYQMAQDQVNNAYKRDALKQSQSEANQKAATDLATTQANNDVSQGNNRANNASSVLNNSFNTVSDMATKGMAPGQGDIAANGMQAMLNIAPGFQAAMGGQPVSQDHVMDIARQVMSGVPFAQAVTSTAQSVYGPGNPDYDRQAAAAKAGGMEGSANTPPFVAP